MRYNNPRGKMVLYIPCSKTDQLRKCDKLVIAKTHNKTCPIAMLESYLSETGILLSNERWLFRPICKSSKSEKLRESGCISYSCMRDLFKKLKDLGYNPDEIGLHSLRAGGATAVANSGCQIACLWDMGDGNPRVSRTAMWRTPWSIGWRLPRTLGFDLFRLLCISMCISY